MIDYKIKKKKAFSLAEVMIALVIVAILMAASAPLVNRRASIDNNFSCYWNNATNGIYFNEKGTGQVGIGTEPSNNIQVLHLASNNANAPQIAFYDNLTDLNNVLGLYNNNIQIGADGNIDGTNNVVIGHASGDYKADGSKLIIGARDASYTPIFYGVFNQTLASQLLKVNGQLQVGTTSVALDSTKPDYSLIVDEQGIYSGGNILSYGDFKTVDASNNTVAEIGHHGVWLNNLGINITSSNGNFGISNTGNITGNSLAIGSAGITSAGRINGTDFQLSNTFISSGGNISTEGTLSTKGTASIGKELYVGKSMIIKDGNFYMGQGSTSWKAYINAAGTINTVSDVNVHGKVNANGDIQTKGDVYSRGSQLTSDARLKKDIVDTDLGLEVIRKINIKNYKFKKETKKDNVHIGVIAQDIQKILPSAVHKGEDGFLSISTNDIFFVAINAIKELDKELQSLKNQNNELKNQVELLKKQNQNLEKRLSKIEKQLKLDKN